MAANLRRLSRTTFARRTRSASTAGTACGRTRGRCSTIRARIQLLFVCRGFGGQRCESLLSAAVSERGDLLLERRRRNQQQPTRRGNCCRPQAPVSSAYACKCLGRWTGTVCDVAYENCGNRLQCFNRGTSCWQRESTEDDYYECRCPAGYEGPSCRDESLLTEATPPRDALWGMVRRGPLCFRSQWWFFRGLALILLRRRKQRHQPTIQYFTMILILTFSTSSRYPIGGRRRNGGMLFSGYYCFLLTTGSFDPK